MVRSVGGAGCVWAAAEERICLRGELSHYGDDGVLRWFSHRGDSTGAIGLAPRYETR